MSTSLVNRTKNRNGCEIVFHFLQFKIHLNILTDEEFEFFFKNCQEYLTGKTNGYKYFLKKCLKCGSKKLKNSFGINNKSGETYKTCINCRIKDRLNRERYSNITEHINNNNKVNNNNN